MVKEEPEVDKREQGISDRNQEAHDVYVSHWRGRITIDESLHLLNTIVME